MLTMRPCPALPHQRHHGAAHVVDADQVDVDDARPLVRVVVGQRHRGAGEAGAVDQEVDAAPARCHAGGRGVDSGAVGDVDPQRGAGNVVGRRSQDTTVAPASRNCRPTSAPMPLAPPVTTATRPAKSYFALS
jgi:hypothetical protein